MIDNKDVTAKWARETAQDILGDKILKQVDTCVNTIKKAVEKNEMTANVFISLDTLAIKELERRGFTVTKIPGDFRDPRDTDYFKISW